VLWLLPIERLLNDTIEEVDESIDVEARWKGKNGWESPPVGTRKASWIRYSNCDPFKSLSSGGAALDEDD